MLGTVLDVFRLRQYFNAVTLARELGTQVYEDVGFVNTIRRALVTLPFEDTSVETRPFPPPRALRLQRLRERRVGLVATGGSGALASVVGCLRAFEEAGITPSVISVCSGSALFGFPLAAGIPAEEVAEFTLSMSSADFVDINWSGLATLTTGARGFAGIIRGERIESTYRRLLGDMCLGDLSIPCYAPVWNIEGNRIEYLGPTTHPDLPVARAVRTAIAIPLFIDPVPLDGSYWCDGGIVDIFPVRPLLELEERPDVVLAVNGFYPPDFAGEDATGWKTRAASILHIASQIRTAQQIELARENLARLRASTEVLMTNPVPYAAVRGAGFYQQFLDHKDWPGFMRSGREAARTAMQGWERGAAARPGRGRGRTSPAPGRGRRTRAEA